MRIGYFVAETIQNLRRNFLMSIAAVSTVAISLLLLGGVQILGITVSRMTADWEEKVEVTVFLRRDASQNEISALEGELSQMDEVKEVNFISKEEAFEQFSETYPDLTQGFLKDALPASFRLRLTDANFAPEVAARVAGAPAVDEVDAGEGFIETLLKVNSLLRAVTLAMSVILMVAAAALIANTIRLAIYARREEIGIMKLVGATNWFIRVPFMLEGLLTALVGAIVSVGVVLTASWLLFNAASRVPLFHSVLIFDGAQMLGVSGWMIGFGMIVGIIGSYLAVHRFLEV